jgi:Fe-S cluster assembly ATP-binding protein
MLKIKNLSAETDEQPLLVDINLEIKAGEIHVVMGPEGSGKTALAHIIGGHPGMQITEGSILWNRKKIQATDATDRSKLGIFLSFQYPAEFDNCSNWDIVKEMFSINHSGVTEVLVKYAAYCEMLGLGAEHGDRQPNGASMTIGQAKLTEIVHMLILDPKLVVLDELDHGLSDSDVLIAGVVIKDFIQSSDKGCLVITKNQKLLEILEPTHVHVMVDNTIKLSGGADLYKRIVEDGYSEFS